MDQVSIVTMPLPLTQAVLAARKNVAQPFKAAKQVDPLIAMRAELDRLAVERNKAAEAERTEFHRLPKMYQQPPSLTYTDPYGVQKVVHDLSEVEGISHRTMSWDEWNFAVMAFQPQKEHFDKYRATVGYTALKEQYDAAFNAWQEYLKQFLSTPAISAAGLSAQIEVMSEYSGLDRSLSDWPDGEPEECFLFSTITALRRLLK